MRVAGSASRFARQAANLGAVYLDKEGYPQQV
jgi:hypothetical protein